jgi:hypothetical protein
MQLLARLRSRPTRGSSLTALLVAALTIAALGTASAVARGWPRRADPALAGTPGAGSSGRGAGGTPGPQAARDPAAPGDPAVAPLRRLESADIYVTASRPLPVSTLARIRRARGVSATVAVSVGQLTVSGRRVGAIAVDPSSFRNFTPRLTAASDPLWQSVAAAELTASFRTSQEMRLPLGQRLPVAGATETGVRVGAFADTGLPGADVMVSRPLGETLGLSGDSGIVISAPKADPLVLRAALTTIVGRSGTVQLLRRPVIIRQREVPIPSGLASVPRLYLQLYQDAARTCAGLPWPVLAAIGLVESAHGVNAGVSSAGAMGPMQFLPSSFAAYGVDGNGDGRLDINDPADAIFSAANYLCDHGGGQGGQALYDAVFAYNHADWYVRLVFQVAQQYAAASRG